MYKIGEEFSWKSNEIVFDTVTGAQIKVVFFKVDFFVAAHRPLCFFVMSQFLSLEVFVQNALWVFNLEVFQKYALT